MSASKIVKFFSMLHRKSMTAKFGRVNKKCEKDCVVFVGDSITENIDIKAIYPTLKAYNRGISADTTKGLLTRLNQSIFDLQPSLIIFLMGTNDLCFYDSSLEDLCKRYRCIFSQIKEKLENSQVIIQGIYPVDPSVKNGWIERGGLYELIQKANAYLQSLAKELGYLYVDMGELLSENGVMNQKLSEDGLHPNLNAERLIAEILMAQIKELPQNERYFITKKETIE